MAYLKDPRRGGRNPSRVAHQTTHGALRDPRAERRASLDGA